VNAIVRTILQRLGFGLITLFVVSVVLSLLVGSLPGDFGTRTLGQAATPETGGRIPA
jgi:peptide/nickel transport system permease protein